MKYTYSPQQGKFGHCTMAQVWDEKSNSICYINSTELEADATQTALQFSKTPEMIEALEVIIRTAKDPDNSPDVLLKVILNFSLLLKEIKP